MTKPAILETLARAIHCHDGRLPTPWDADMIARWPDDCEYERKVAMSQAAAVLELVGPKPLHWMNNGNHWAGGLGWVVRKMGSQYVLTKASRFDQNFDTLEAAQSAAQAHADAAHWANCPLGKLAGVV